MGLNDHIHAQALSDRRDAEAQSSAQRSIEAEHARQRAAIRAEIAARRPGARQ